MTVGALNEQETEGPFTCTRLAILMSLTLSPLVGACGNRPEATPTVQQEQGPPKLPEGAYAVPIAAGEEPSTTKGEAASIGIELSISETSNTHRWTITTTCDTASTGSHCNWNLDVSSVTHSTTDFVTKTLEPGDSATAGATSAIVEFVTHSDEDTIEMSTPVASYLRLDAMLEGSEAKHYPIWHNGEMIAVGVTELPVHFVPID